MAPLYFETRLLHIRHDKQAWEEEVRELLRVKQDADAARERPLAVPLLRFLSLCVSRLVLHSRAGSGSQAVQARWTRTPHAHLL